MLDDFPSRPLQKNPTLPVSDIPETQSGHCSEPEAGLRQRFSVRLFLTGTDARCFRLANVTTNADPPQKNNP